MVALFGEKKNETEVELEQNKNRNKIQSTMEHELRGLVFRLSSIMRDLMVKQLEKRYDDDLSVWARGDPGKRSLFPETEVALSCLAIDESRQDLLWFTELAEFLAPAPHVVSLAEDATKLLGALGHTAGNFAAAMNYYTSLMIPRRCCTIYCRNPEDPLLLQLAVSLDDGTNLADDITPEMIANLGVINRRRLVYYFAKFEDEAGLLKAQPAMEADSALAREALVGACASGSLRFARRLWPLAVVDFKSGNTTLPPEDPLSGATIIMPQPVFKAKTTMSAWSPFTAACLSGNVALCQYLTTQTHNNPDLAAHLGCYDGSRIVPLLRSRKQIEILTLIE